MARNIMDANMLLNPNPQTMIPLIKFKINETNANVYINYKAPASLEEKVNIGNNISLNPSTDYLYLYNITKKTIQDVGDIFSNGTLITDSGCANNEFAIMAYPHTIYKFNTLNFKDNINLVNISDIYVYNLIDYFAMFANCFNITEYNAHIYPSNILDINAFAYAYDYTKVFNYDYIFSNNFNARKLPVGNISLSEDDVNDRYNSDNKISLSYAFMNTKNAANASLVTKLYNAKVYEYGGNGIFFNSNIPFKSSNLSFMYVYEMRNTFAGTTDKTSDNYINLNSSNCKSLESSFRDSIKFKEISISLNTDNIKNMNNTFKNLINATSISFNNSATSFIMDELIGLFSGCKLLTYLPNVITFSGSKIICDLYKNCTALPFNKLTEIKTESAVIASGMFSGCKTIDNFFYITTSTDKPINLTSAYLINELFKDCTSVITFDVGLNLGTSSREVYADSIFSGCTKLTSAPSITGKNLIVSSEEMFRGTQISSINYSDMTNNKNVSGMFLDCVKLTNSILLPAAVFASNLYAGCEALTSATINLSNARYLVATFKNCTSLNTISNNGNLNKAIDASSILEGCTSLTSGTENINTSNCKTLVAAYKGCRNLTTATVNISNAENIDSIFYGCTNLNTLDLTWGNTSPRISLRGTALTVSAINNIISGLPDVSSYVTNSPTDKLSGINWSDYNGFNLCKTLYAKTFKSDPITLTPGEYVLSIPGSYEISTTGYSSGTFKSYVDVGACVINIATNEIMSTLMYSSGYTTTSKVNINKTGQYIVVINSNTSTRPSVSLLWNTPYHKIDIRDTPGAANLSSINVSVANDKGWHVIYKDTQVVSLAARRAVSVNKIENNNTIDLTELQSNTIENDMYTTETFNINSGYYTLYSKSDNNDNFKVYKVLEDGEYPIAISYDNDYVLCFNLEDNSDIRIVYKNENKDLILQKS